MGEYAFKELKDIEEASSTLSISYIGIDGQGKAIRTPSRPLVFIMDTQQSGDWYGGNFGNYLKKSILNGALVYLYEAVHGEYYPMASFSIKKRSTTVGNTDTQGTIRIRFIADDYPTNTTGVGEFENLITYDIPYLE